MTKRNGSKGSNGRNGSNGNGSNGRNERKGHNGNGNGSVASNKALEIWEMLQKQTNSIIDKIILFNSFYAREDYIQEAYIACFDAVLRYDSYVKSNKNSSDEGEDQTEGCEMKRGWRSEVLTNDEDDSVFSSESIVSEVTSRTVMRIDVFAYWFIQKRLYKKANRNEVVFNVYDETGEFQKTISNSEYRKGKKEFDELKCRVTSSNILKNVKFHSDDDDHTTPDYMDSNFLGFSEEVKEMLHDDLNKYKVDIK